MLDADNVVENDEVVERMPPVTLHEEGRGQAAALMIRRRIEQMRELRRLRELIDDPDFNDLN